MHYITIAAPSYAGVLVLGILFWAWRNSKNRLYVSRGLPPALLAKFPKVSELDRRRAFLWGIPVLGIMFTFPLAYSIYARLVLGDGFLSVLLGNFVLLLSYNVADLLIVDWLLICLITPKFFVVPGTEGDPGYKDYPFHLHGAFKGLIFVVLGSVAFSAVAELVFWIFGAT